MTAIKPVTESKTVAALKKAATGNDARVRHIFEKTEDAKKAFESASKLAAENGLPSWSAADDKFGDGMTACVALVSSREDAPGGKKQQGIKAVVMFPMPTIHTFLSLKPNALKDADSKALDWMKKVVEKEAAHVAFREVRDCSTTEEFQQMAEKIPASVDDYVIAHTRGGDGIDLTTFNTIWSDYRVGLKEEMPVLVEALPSKQEIIKCLRSKPYALRTESELEKRGAFVYILNKLIEACGLWQNAETGQPEPLESDTLEEWLAERDEFDPYKAVDYSKLDGLDLGIGS